MHITWFRPHPPDPQNPLDATGQLIDALRARHTIQIVDEAGAHDAVWRQSRHPADLHVYELDNTRDSAFIWPYLLRYPGLTLLLGSTLARSRGGAVYTELHQHHRQEERTFDAGGPGPMLRVPLLASRLVATPHPALALMLARDYPEARVRAFTPGIDAVRPAPAAAPGAVVTFGQIATDSRQRGVIERAAQRAREAGAQVRLCLDGDARTVLRDSDVLLALHWPTSGRILSESLAAMVAGRVPVAFETLETADWPSVDPQTWQPRDPVGSRPPVCVTIDLRDEEHSLMLVMRRLAGEPSLRARLGAAAHEWWRTRFTLQRAVDTFEPLLDDARSSAAPARPPDWPGHLDADATETARQILQEFGLTVDLLEQAWNPSHL